MAQDLFSSSSDMDLRKRWALLQLQQAGDASPVRHPLQAVARALQGAMGGYLAGEAEREDKAAGDAMFNNLPGLGGSQSQAAPSVSQPMGNVPVSGDIPKIISDAAGKYGVDPKYLMRTASLESAFNPSAANPNSSAKGLFQFTNGTWGQYGNGGNPLDASASADAAARLTRDNMAAFRQKFGRDPSPGELYLMHQQGAGGASALLADPKANAVDALTSVYGGDKAKATAAVVNNGGSPLQTAGDFANRWTGKFGGQQTADNSALPPGAAPAQFQGPNGQAQTPARTQLNIPPEVAATIKRLGSDPRTRGQAWQLYLQYAKPTEQYVQGVSASGVPYQKNVVTGKIEADPTRDAAINETEYARSNWQKLGFPDPKSSAPADQQFWQSFNAKRLGGPSTNVTVDQRGENEFSKEAGKLTAQRYNGMIEDVPAAKQMLSDVQTLTTLGRQIGTGKEAQIKAALGPYAEALGVKIDKLGEIQAFEAIVNRVAPALRVKGSGAQSDYELKNFLKSLPSLGTTPEGNEMASRVMQGLYENKLKAADIASAALNGEITRKEADQRIRDLPDPMKEYRDYVKSNPGASVRPNDEGGWTVIDGVKIREKK